MQKNTSYGKTVIKIESVKASDTARLYTIIFENEDLSEFAKFMTRFKDNSKLQRDYQLILYAMQKTKGASELKRLYYPELTIKSLNYENYSYSFR